MSLENVLLAGAAKRCITPEKDLLTRVRGLMGIRFVDVADDLFVRVLALNDGRNTTLFCVFDLDKAPNPESSMAAITERFGIPERFITFCGIHTHAAPALGKRPNEQNNNVRALNEDVAEATDQYEQFVHGKLMESVADALRKLQPAVLRFSYEPCGCNINRSADFYQIQPDGSLKHSVQEGLHVLGPVDHNAYVAALETPDGTPIAYLINYAMHNTVMFMNPADEQGNCRISGDVGGNVARMVEEKYGAVAIWCSGAAGDVAPLRGEMRMRRHPEELPYAFEYRKQHTMLEQICANHFASVVKAIEKRPVPLENTAMDAAVMWTSTPGRTVIRKGPRGAQQITVLSGADQPPYQIRLHLVAIGKILIVGIGGELYSAYALRLKELFPDCHVIVINHDASMIMDAGYIMDDDTIARIAHIPLTDRCLPGFPVRYERGYIADAISDCVRNFISCMEGRE